MVTYGKPIQQTPGLMVVWGDKSSCTVNPKHNLSAFLEENEKKRRAYGLQALWFFKQEHTVSGRIISGSAGQGAHYITEEDGDYFITNAPGVGIGVGTADCLPIVFYDSVAHVVAVAHAGWKGSVQGIAPIVLRQLQQRFGAQLENIQVWFGPHAKQCCYEVAPDFENNLFHKFIPAVIEHRDGKCFFSNAHYNEMLLLSAGLQENQMHSEAAQCTMCEGNFHSRRIDGPEYIGQSTIAWLQL